MMLRRLFASANRLRTRDIVGSVVVGENRGIIYQLSGVAPPSLPTLPWAEALPETGAPFEIFNLLSWKCRLSRDLQSRDAERTALLDWARNGPKLRIRFLTGPGGAGKSRLAAEIAAGLTGWHAGFAPLDKSTALPLSDKGLLVIIDYPEAWPEQLANLLRESARAAPPPGPIRLLILTRRPLGDWSKLIEDCGATTLCDAQEIAVGPLGPNAAAALLRMVVARLAAHRKRPAPPLDDTAIASWLHQRPDLHGLPLLTTAAAIHFVDEPGDTLRLDAARIVDALVRRERVRLDGAGRAAGLGWHAASRLFALAALREGLDATAIRRLATPELEIGLPDSSRAVDAVRAAGFVQTERVFAPAPDIVASELLRQIIADAGDRAGEWIWATLSDPGALQAELLDRRLHDMVTLHGPGERLVLERLLSVVTNRPERAHAWEALADMRGGFRLSSLAAAVAAGLLATPNLDDENRAALLNNLSVHQTAVGDNAGALTAISKATEIYRRLARENPVRFAPDLAMSFNNLSNLLSDAGDDAGALRAIRDAVEIRRRLAAENPARFGPDLAQSLSNLSTRLSDVGDSAGATGHRKGGGIHISSPGAGESGALCSRPRDEPQQPVAPGG